MAQAAKAAIVQALRLKPFEGLEANVERIEVEDGICFTTTEVVSADGTSEGEGETRTGVSTEVYQTRFQVSRCRLISAVSVMMVTGWEGYRACC